MKSKIIDSFYNVLIFITPFLTYKLGLFPYLIKKNSLYYDIQDEINALSAIVMMYTDVINFLLKFVIYSTLLVASIFFVKTLILFFYYLKIILTD